MHSTSIRSIVIGLWAAILCIMVIQQPALAALRDQMKNRVVDDVANQMVAQIQNDSCPEFAAMLKNAKGQGGSGSASGMMKKDPALRERFVNKVAGPLLNKMIDCDMLPGH
jgi:hypothetical protein